MSHWGKISMLKWLEVFLFTLLMRVNYYQAMPRYCSSEGWDCWTFTAEHHYQFGWEKGFGNWFRQTNLCQGHYLLHTAFLMLRTSYSLVLKLSRTINRIIVFLSVHCACMTKPFTWMGFSVIYFCNLLQYISNWICR